MLFNKTKIFFLTTSLFLIIFTCSGYFFINSKKESESFEVSFQSPCRGLVQKKITTLKLEDHLDYMMKTPIDWILKDTSGDILDLSCYKDKKIIILNLWATACAPCIEELPSLSLLADQNPDDILVVAVTTDDSDLIHSFLQRSFPDLSPHFKVASISEEEKSYYFPSKLIPMTYIFDKQGLLKDKVLGSRSWHDKDALSYIRSF